MSVLKIWVKIKYIQLSNLKCFGSEFEEYFKTVNLNFWCWNKVNEEDINSCFENEFDSQSLYDYLISYASYWITILTQSTAKWVKKSITVNYSNNRKQSFKKFIVAIYNYGMISNTLKYFTTFAKYAEHTLVNTAIQVEPHRNLAKRTEIVIFK